MRIFDLVVLSVGLESSQDALTLAKTMGIEVKATTRFADTSPFTPVDTSKDGVYVCGVFQAPKDIPQSVMEASAAAAAAGELLGRGPGHRDQGAGAAPGDRRGRPGPSGGRLCL